MPNERESLSALTVRDYDIVGNLLRAYFDADGKIVFVLDLLVDESKPNVLLVIDAVDNRKWDDILENDYGVDLENVRPKKDNKYQKLDIEYSGLPVYQELINKHMAGDDISGALATLDAFRHIAVRRAAAERLVAAETVAENARETIEKTNETIDELNARLRQLRAKLADVRKNIGKEPTKQSAAKVLRTESQIDATNEKVRRAKKRLDNAQKRLVSATDDADMARDILARLEDTDADLPVIMPEHPVAVLSTEETPIITNNTKAEDMADEEIKPLFDTDPEILDEEIAFKPIDFNAPIVAPDMTPAVQTEPGVPDVYDDASAIAPLSFTPPIAGETFQETDIVLPSQVSEPTPAPVLDSITAVDTPVGMDVVEQQTEFIPQPVAPSYAQPVSETVPMSDIAPAPADSGFRPVSPLTGVAPVAVPSDSPKRKQSLVYYIMLIALIVMSVFVLWFYQKTTGDSALPNIADKVVPEIPQPVEEPQVQEEPVSVEPVAQEVTVTETVDPEPVIVEEPAPIEQEPMPEPVVIEAELVPVEPTEVVVPVSTPVLNTVPTIVPEPEVVKVETEAEILAKKPAYGVSQNDAMFVASDDFETDRLGPAVTEEDVVVVDMYDTPIIRAPETAPVVEYSEPEIVQGYTESGQESPCENGSPDRFGCCPGESYTQIDNGGFVCCPDAGGDCFPPLF